MRLGRWPGPTDVAVGLLVSAGAVGLVTAVIGLIRSFVPVLSLGVLYVFAVLPIAAGWGVGLAILVSIASMLAFNWFYLPPTHTFTLAEGENWFAWPCTSSLRSWSVHWRRGRGVAQTRRIFGAAK